MEILDSGEPFLHWDRNLSELSEPGENDGVLYSTVSIRLLSQLFLFIPLFRRIFVFCSVCEKVQWRFAMQANIDNWSLINRPCCSVSSHLLHWWVWAVAECYGGGSQRQVTTVVREQSPTLNLFKYLIPAYLDSLIAFLFCGFPKNTRPTFHGAVRLLLQKTLFSRSWWW